MMKFLTKIFFILVVLAGVCQPLSAADTADAVLRKTAAAIKGANGLSASFTMISGSGKVTGTLKSYGSKFSLVTSSASTWYDGKTMWTYNSHNNETTVITPTPVDLSEANPLYIVNDYSKNFTAAFAKSQKKGGKTLVLTPKSRKLGYKSVHIIIPDNSSFPSKMTIVPSSGQRIDITVSGVKTGQKFAASQFTYPSKNYPGAEIIDLR